MKIICVGRNYPRHIKELVNQRPESPVIFIKPDTSLLQKNNPFFIPDFSRLINYELELLVKINRIGKYIQPKFAFKYYREIGLGIDFTARDIQQQLKEKGLPWEKAKGFDGSALIGEWFDKSNFEDINKLDFHLLKNGIVTQIGNSSQMIWKIDELISEISKFFTLKIGDIIFTGTPEGVGDVQEDDLLEGFLMNEKAFSIKIK
ncbi:MAG: fumarylacetoacetate hydrolase family protein [Bacteroidota bacterium]|nr:fumarylacetoacetate hydrolase family protein [Bacteroidota bacterium]MEE2723623.1 fumarylacetoacetate hydrolase family protein [Bacteroidota bacterium]